MKKRKVRILFTSIIASMFLTMTSCGNSPSEHTHSWSTSWSSDETYHWHKCTGCDAINDKAEHTFVTTVIEPDYDHQGYTHHECSICEYSYNDHYVDPLEHHYSSTWSKDESAHWHACIDEGYETLTKDYALHDFGEWIIDEPATKEHDGTRHHVCNTCSYLHSETYKFKEPVPVERVYLATTSYEIIEDFTYTLRPVVFPNEAEANVKYDIENPDLLEINNNVALAKQAGTTLVFAYNDNDNDNIRDESEPFIATSFSLLERDESKAVEVDPALIVKVDETKKLVYSFKNITSTGFDVGFYSEDDSICGISGGNVKGYKPGTTRVSVSCQGYRGYCTVTVINNEDEHGLRASEIKSVDNLVLNKGDSQTLAYEILPLGSVDKLSSITSNNERVIKVNEDKSITAINGGSAVVTLTTGNNKFTRVFVTVKDNANLESSYYNNYYGNLTWENGEDLKAKLHNIISNYNPIGFKTSSKNNWESNQFADQDLYDSSYVHAVYSDDPILKSNTNTGWQREHAFAASLMTGFSTGGAAYSKGRATDFHNLYASHAGANGSRGNKNFGYVNPSSIEYSEYGNAIYTKSLFEPTDADKGKLARAIFYMGVLYNTTEVVSEVKEKWTFKGEDIPTHSSATTMLTLSGHELPLQIVEDNIDYSKVSLDEFMQPSTIQNTTLVNYYRELVKEENDVSEQDYDNFRRRAFEIYTDSSMPYAIGHLSDLIKWNSFEVDLNEMQHNQSVYSFNNTTWGGIQGNRNPFVDYPQLVDYIYGDLKDVPGSLSELTPSYLTLQMDKDEIHHYSLNSENIREFIVGEKPTIDDFNIKAIKNNLSETALDKSKIIIPDYTFTEDDVENGKVLHIETDKNDFDVKVKVTNGTAIAFEDCNYQFIARSTKPQDEYTKKTDTTYTLTSGGITFNVETGNPVNISASGGAKFGTASSSVGSLTFETSSAVTISGKNIINAVCLRVGASAAANIYKYSIYVGDTLLGTDTFNGTAVRDICVQDTASRNLSGKVKIVFSDVKTYIVIKGIAINAIA